MSYKIGVTETHMRGWEVKDCDARKESLLWEGMVERCKEREKEGCTLVVAEREWRRMDKMDGEGKESCR